MIDNEEERGAQGLELDPKTKSQPPYPLHIDPAIRLQDEITEVHKNAVSLKL